jgi:hypothetical protein
MAITINTDGITEEQKASPRFQSAYRSMLAQLLAPGFIPVLCAHEAAHAIYFTAAGTVEFEPKPATLQYNPSTDDYEGHLAAIQLKDMKMWVPGKFQEWFSNIARGYVAGGVVARKFNAIFGRRRSRRPRTISSTVRPTQP